MHLQKMLDAILRSAEVMNLTHRNFARRSFLHKDHVHDDH